MILTRDINVIVINGEIIINKILKIIINLKILYYKL